jgi:membrane-bound serine protease (ClpP class)
MTWTLLPFLLILLGLVLLIAEVFIPSGGLISVLSMICIICGVAMVFYYNDPYTGMVTLTALMVLLPITIGVSFYFWPRTPIGKQMILAPPTADEEELELKPELERLLGQIGKTVTPLRPSGVTLIQGRRMDSKTEGLFVDANQWVRVVDIQAGNQIIVRALSTDEIEQLDNLTT